MLCMGFKNWRWVSRVWRRRRLLLHVMHHFFRTWTGHHGRGRWRWWWRRLGMTSIGHDSTDEWLSTVIVLVGYERRTALAPSPYTLPSCCDTSATDPC